MSDPVGVESAVEAATYVGLVASPKLRAATVEKPAALATVYQHVPQNTAPPVVIIGDLDAEPFAATKAEDEDQLVTLVVIAVTEGEERKPNLAILRAIKTALNGLRVDRDGWSLSFKFLSSDGALLEPGDTYEGRNLFQVTALKDT